jgi:hypothetical protein
MTGKTTLEVFGQSRSSMPLWYAKVFCPPKQRQAFVI